MVWDRGCRVSRRALKLILGGPWSKKADPKRGAILGETIVPLRRCKTLMYMFRAG